VVRWPGTLLRLHHPWWSALSCSSVSFSFVDEKVTPLLTLVPPSIDFGEQAGNQLTWTVNITSGTKVTYKVKDQTGTENFNSEVTISQF
jgi:hypothetical protein